MRKMTTMGALLLCAGVAHATIITPASVTFTGTATELAGAGLDDENGIIDGSGLSATVTDANIGTVTHAGVNFAGNSWTTTDPGGPGSDFFAATGDTAIFEFDLGTTTSVGTFASWGYHFGGYNGNTISDVTLDFSTDGGSTTDSSQTIAVPYGATFDGSTVVPLTLVPAANYITMTVNDNHFDPNGPAGGDRVGVAEIVFSSVVIPEPTTLSLLAVCGVAILCRRKRAA